MCDPGVVSAPTPSPRTPRLVVGGNDEPHVARLHRALAEIFAGPLARATSAVGGEKRAMGNGDHRPLLVPISPHEDPDAVRADLSRRLDGVPERADIILRTSGSTTGTASLVAMSAAALIASARATHERLGGPGTWVLALPAHHVAGLQVLVRSIVAGTRPVIVDTTGGFEPGALAAALERALKTGGPVYVSLVPTQLLRVLTNSDAAASLALADAVLVGGAATDPELLRRARAVRIRVVTTYGMSETGGGCVYDGVPLGGVRVSVENPDETGAGRIVLAGPVLAEGYVEARVPDAGAGRPDGVARGGAEPRVPDAAAADAAVAQTVPGGASATGGPPGAPHDGLFRQAIGAAFFRADPREFVTADRGRLETLPDGSARLTVLGRLDDLIVTGGIKVDPREVEQVLVALPGVARACVVGVPDEVWGSAVVAAVVPEAGARLDGEELRGLARAHLDGAHAPKRVLVVPDLPLRGPGKTDRRAVAAFFESV